jgi:peptidyl-prolyl cis-trans isomerase SurA
MPLSPGLKSGRLDQGVREAMLRITSSALCSVAAAAALAAACLFAAPVPARAQTIAVLVDGEPITALDIEQRSKFMQMSTHKVPTRQEVIDSLIDEILEVREAKKYSIDVSQADVDEAYAGVATRMNVDAQKLNEILTKGGASPETLKHKLKADYAWGALVRGRYKSSLEVADTDVEAQLELHKPDEKNLVGYEYTLRPILLVVPRGSADSTFDERKKDAEALRLRFADCASGVPFARALREVAVRDPMIKFSSDLPSAQRDILDKTDVGHLTPPEQTSEGIQMFAVCSKKESKADTPGKKQVRDEILQQKFGAKAKRYLAELHREAMIEYK